MTAQLCVTPWCGHTRDAHMPGRDDTTRGECLHPGCPCTCYTPPVLVAPSCPTCGQPVEVAR